MGNTKRVYVRFNMFVFFRRTFELPFLLYGTKFLWVTRLLAMVAVTKN